MKKPQVEAISNYEIGLRDPDDVDFTLLSVNQLTSPNASLIPIQNAVQPTRLFYGARFGNQAQVVVNSEAPLVQTQADDNPGESFDDRMGQYAGAIRSDLDGTVEDVQDNLIKIRTPDGQQRKIELFRNHPFNRYSGMTQTPVVQKGQVIKPKDLLARSNYTDKNGSLALGLNARVGVVPFKGFSMDDAIVVSQAFANRATSQHFDTMVKSFKHGDLRPGMSHYVSLFPQKFTKEQLATLDDDGVIKPGQTVQPGDPLILATRPRNFNSAQSASLARLGKVARQLRADAATTWDNDDPGVVHNVVRKRDGTVKIVMESHRPMRMGDKVAMRSGQKCYHPDTEIFTERGWVRVQDVQMTDNVAALFDASASSSPTGRRKRPTQQFVAKFVRPWHLTNYGYRGELCGLDAGRAAYLVTPEHRVWRAGHMGKTPRWYCQDAAEVEGTPQKFLTACPFDLQDRATPQTYSIPAAQHGLTGDSMPGRLEFAWCDWVRFLAIYLAEGNIRHAHPNDHSIVITQKEKPFCRVVEEVLSNMGMTWRIDGNQYTTIPHKALRSYLEKFGKAVNKFIPEYILNSDDETLRLFKQTIWQCDGDKDRGKQYYSSSPMMIEGVGRILTQLGMAFTANWRDAREHQNHDACTVHIQDTVYTSTKKNYADAYYREMYNGRVYCLQVPGLGVVLTRFRGRIMWNGNCIVSKIIPDEEMPRTQDGKPLEVLLNQQGIPSRANPSLIWEILLGKVAAAKGAPLKLPAFNRNDDSWTDFVEQQLLENNLKDQEVVYDPKDNRRLDNPITVGNAYVLKLHHIASKKNSSRGQAGYDCFDAETEVFTARGWIKWAEVTIKDKLLDPQTLEDGTLGGDFVTPMKLQSYHFEGEMLRWDSKFLNCVVTPNHKFHVRLERAGPVRERTAAQLYARDGKATLPCTATWTGGANPAFKIVAGVAPPAPQSSRQWEFSEDLQVNFADYADFAAWYIAEGSFQVRLGLGRYRVFIWQNEIANPQECQAIKALLTRLGLAWYPVRRKGLTVGYAFQDARWALLVQTWGAYAWTKHIPEDIMMAAPEIRRLFLATYLKGDGSETNYKKTDGRKKLNRISSVASTSPHVIRSLEFLLTSLGMAYGVQNYPSGVMTCPASDKTYDRRAYSVIGIHLVRKVASMVSKKRDSRYEGTWQKVPYCGRVYCATMPSGKLLVRREGKMCITGNSNEQPSRGSGLSAGAKRRSGLEIVEMLSSGAYNNLRESSTLSGQKNDAFWRDLRAGLAPKPPGSPFVWYKFRALLNGAGMHARDMGQGKLRLGLMTDKILDKLSPLPVRNGKTIHFKTLEPEEGGLFNSALVGGQRWGYIDLPEPMPNPAAEDSVRTLLGLSRKDFEAVLAGEMELPEDR